MATNAAAAGNAQRREEEEEEEEEEVNGRTGFRAGEWMAWANITGSNDFVHLWQDWARPGAEEEEEEVCPKR